MFSRLLVLVLTLFECYHLSSLPCTFSFDYVLTILSLLSLLSYHLLFRLFYFLHLLSLLLFLHLLLSLLIHLFHRPLSFASYLFFSFSSTISCPMDHTDATRILSSAETIKPIATLLSTFIQTIADTLGGPLLLVM